MNLCPLLAVSGCSSNIVRQYFEIKADSQMLSVVIPSWPGQAGRQTGSYCFCRCGHEGFSLLLNVERSWAKSDDMNNWPGIIMRGTTSCQREIEMAFLKIRILEKSTKRISASKDYTGQKFKKLPHLSYEASRFSKKFSLPFCQIPKGFRFLVAAVACVVVCPWVLSKLVITLDDIGQHPSSWSFSCTFNFRASYDRSFRDHWLSPQRGEKI